MKITRTISVKITIPKDTVEEAEGWWDVYFPEKYIRDAISGSLVGDVEHTITIKPISVEERPDC